MGVQTQKWNGRQLNGRVTKSEEMIRVLAAVAESTSGVVANESVSTPEVAGQNTKLSSRRYDLNRNYN